MLKRYLLHLPLAALLAAALACSVLQTTPPTATLVPTPAATDRQLKVFDAAWEAVRDQYVRADYSGVDWEAVRTQYRPQVEAGQSEEAFADTMRAMLGALPNNQASYQTRAERLEQETANTTTYHGIGAFISFRETPEPHVVILAVVEDSPAQAAGLEAHDSILAIDGVPFTLADAESPADRIRGLPDSNVTLTVQSPGDEPRDVSIDRAEISAVDVLRGGYLETLNIAYYRVPVVANGNLAENIAADLDATAQGATLDGIVIDLRVARSSANWPLSNMLALFGDGDLGEFYNRDSADTITLTGLDAGGSQTLPLVLLVGPDTAGSPEIFAAALQASGRAVLIGQATPGEVEGFDEIALPDGSRMFLATSSFRTADNLDLAQTGLTPDQVVDADWDSFPTDADPVIEAALVQLLGTAPQ